MSSLTFRVSVSRKNIGRNHTNPKRQRGRHDWEKLPLATRSERTRPMTRYVLAPLFLAGVGMCAIAIPTLARNIQPKSPVEEATQLFNGKDLTNFYTWLVNFHHEDPAKVFTVVDAIDGAP